MIFIIKGDFDMKKLFVVAFAVAAIMLAAPSKAEAAYSSGSALGAGIGFHSGGFGHATLAGLYMTGKIDGIDPVFGLDLGFGTHYFGLNLSADWWLLNPNLGEVGHADVSLYLGPGVGLNLGFADPFSIGLNARLPIGLSWVVKSNWEIFTELLFTLKVVQFGIGSNDTSYIRVFGAGVSGNKGTYYWGNTFSAGLNVGFRYWF